MNEESGSGSPQDDQRREPDTDATSKETLEDVEENEKSAESPSQDDSAKSNVPSPDGADDASRKPDDAGPM